MTWKLWLDDQALDDNYPNRAAPAGFTEALSSQEALNLLDEYGLPELMDLDHDLGYQDTVMDFLKEMAHRYPDGPIPEYRVHSANPLAEVRISSFIESWRKSI